MNERALWIGGVALGATALVAGLAYAASKQTSSATSGSGSTSGTGTTGGSAGPEDVTLVPGSWSITAAAGQQVNFHLPPGGVWNANNSVYATVPQVGFTALSIPTSGTGVASVVFDPTAVNFSKTIQINWTDSSGALQHADVTVSTPVVSSTGGGTTSGSGGGTTTPPKTPGTTIGQNSGVTIIAGAMTTVQDPATTLMIGLPPGGMWSPTNPIATAALPPGVTNVVAGGSVQLTYDGSATATVTLGWIDQSGAAQTTQLTIQPTPGFTGVTMTPGAQSITAASGTVVVIQIPDLEDGGAWASQNMPDPQPTGVSNVIPQRSGSFPVTLTFTGPSAVTLNLSWLDANQASQSTQLTIHS